jgi:ubiquinol-cytochrome c reductase iron-sulfur subunit
LDIIGDHHDANSRRDFLFLATGSTAVIGSAAALWPLMGSLAPDASVVASGQPVEFDLAPIPVGQIVKLFWRGRLVFVRHRSAAEISEARAAKLGDLIDPQTDDERTKPGQAQWLVTFGNCTHLGCVPLSHQGPFNGWFCPCYGSVFDTSGRVRQGPAPKNLPIPPYTFLSPDRIRVGQG